MAILEIYLQKGPILENFVPQNFFQYTVHTYMCAYMRKHIFQVNLT